MNKRSVVIFDVGRVLIEWDFYHLYRKLLPNDEAIAAFIDEVGLVAANIDFDRGTVSYAEGIEALATKHPARADLIRAYDARWMEAVPGPVQPSVDILWRLKAAGVPLYAITNFSAEKWALSQERFDFLRDGFIDAVVSAHEKLIKPDPAIYRVCLERNNLNAEDCVFIDDSEKNIAAAQALGIDGILFTPETDLETELKARGLPL